ncbi:MAG TPA: DivIVA domain-containing protein, partial [Ilumatobacteraceae bacterium]
MDESPQAVAGTTFRIVKKGYDPDEVRAYLSNVSRALTAAQEHAASMEARARQAVAKAQELMQQRQATPERGMKLEDTETISRTLLLAQRTADNTTADARRDAEKTLATARAEAETALAGAKEEALRLVETARADARRAGENERVQVEEELQQLLARLEFLRDDVTQLDRFTGEQRTRLREAAEALNDIAERPVGGLGEHRSPVLSAASDMPPPFGTPVAEVASPVSSATSAGGDESGT